jgi:hypothetical protein
MSPRRLGETEWNPTPTGITPLLANLQLDSPHQLTESSLTIPESNAVPLRLSLSFVFQTGFANRLVAP